MSEDTPTPTRPQATSIETVAAAYDRAGAQYGILGKTVSWHIPSTTVVPLETIKSLLAEVGLEAVAQTLPEVTDKAAINKALKFLGRARLVEEVVDTSDRVVYALVQRDPDRPNNRMRYREEYTVAYYKSGRVPEEMTFLQTSDVNDGLLFWAGDGRDPDANAEAEARIRPLIDRYRICYASRDITGAVLGKTVYLNLGLPLNEKGIFYAVPVTRVEAVDKLRAFVARLAEVSGEVCTFRAWGIPDAPEERDDLAAAAAEALVSQLDQVLADLDYAEKNDAELAARRAVQADEEKTLTPGQQARADRQRNASMDEKEQWVQDILERAAVFMNLTGDRLSQVRTKADLAQRRARALRRDTTPTTPEAARGARLDATPVTVEVAPKTTRGARLDMAPVEGETPEAEATPRPRTRRARTV